MTLSDKATDLRARKQTPDSPTAERATSSSTSSRPALRLVPGTTQAPDPRTTPTVDHAPLGHLEGLHEGVASHAVTARRPPTVAEAAGNLWLSRAEVRHGLTGQLAAAAAGLLQLIGLGLCWSVAHVLFSTKTRSAVFALVFIGTLTTFSIAFHA